MLTSCKMAHSLQIFFRFLFSIFSHSFLEMFKNPHFFVFSGESGFQILDLHTKSAEVVIILRHSNSVAYIWNWNVIADVWKAHRLPITLCLTINVMQQRLARVMEIPIRTNRIVNVKAAIAINIIIR